MKKHSKNFETFNTSKFLNGFTMMEVLIAASIFAMVLIIVTGILGQSSSFRQKTKIMRATSTDSKRLADMITRDIRSANGEAKITGVTQSSSGYNGLITFKDGLALMNVTACPSLVYGEVLSPSTDYPASTGTANQILVIASGSQYKIFGHSVIHNKLYYRTSPRLDSNGNVITLTITEILKTYYSSGSCPPNPSEYSAYDINNLISDNSLNSIVRFRGFTPANQFSSSVSITAQQPFVTVFIQSKTKNYDDASVMSNAKAISEIRTMITSRNFIN